MRLIRCAGLPATRVQGSTSLVTTEPAPIVAPSPTVTPPERRMQQTHIGAINLYLPPVDKLQGLTQESLKAAQFTLALALSYMSPALIIAA